MRSAESSTDSAADEVLLARIGTGDERALAELYARYASTVFAFVLARTEDRDLTEEVTADVWLGCWRSARTFRHDSQVLTWLLGIAKRQIYTHTRRKHLTVIPLEDEHDIPSTADDLDTLVISSEATNTLTKALNTLPTDLTEVVRLAWMHDLPYKDIAQLMNIPIGTVKSRISRARRLLREQLRNQDA
ncbi:RNA polymerase sigma factor [Actinomyces ruminis]|uniref:RNA polymerase subunit sigma-24 n=1 Tax=Actinomyces ruminis TaxID=1937003 RepID=A0ABX4MBC6_9ACTO|nr:sigma-70 family RNA polymerase sigma factor [Actinomyces ruminis]PHP52556.1 RNA polymerase subunit sigma-24 [Actinomyces ruminis]